jgi:hypothetical protein
MSLLPDPGTSFAKAYAPVLYVVAGLVILILLLTLAYCSGGSSTRHADDQETIQLQTHVIAADGNASDARVADTVKLQTQEQELKDVAENSTTSSSDDARHAHVCAILRQQGRDADAHTAGCGPAPTR